MTCEDAGSVSPGEGLAAGRVSTRREAAEPEAIQPLSRWVVLLFALACGLSVGNVYCAQPLLDAMGREFGLGQAQFGLVVTVTQAGYAVGLLLVVPLGDRIDRRRLIVGQLLLSTGALSVAGAAPSAAVLWAGLGLVGLLAVVTQVIVAYSASLAAPAERGRVVGIVTSGVVLGILSARAVAGLLADWADWRAVYFVSAGLTFSIAVALFGLLPQRDAERETMPYPQLLRSVVTLFVEEPLLRVRAVIALLVFAAFSTLWTSLVLPLSAPPFSLSHTAIGAFGLVGVAGAFAAVRAGHWADRGWGQQTSGFGLALLLVSWLPIGWIGPWLGGLIVGVVLLDFAVQAVHVTNQSLIYAVRPEARSRLVAGYMVFYSVGSGAGALASTFVYARSGWTGVCLLGATFSAAALVFWASTVRGSQRAAPGR